MKGLVLFILLAPILGVGQEEPILLSEDTVVSNFRPLTVFEIPDVKAQFVGGEEALWAFLLDRIPAPLVPNTANPMDIGKETKGANSFSAWVEGIVEADGKAVYNHIHVPPGMNSIAAERARHVIADVFDSMPQWQAAQLKGKRIRSKFRVTVPLNGREEEAVFYTSCERMPEFVGGDEAKLNFLQKHLSYPEKQKQEGIEGLVIVNAIISKAGKVLYPQIAKSLHTELDKEALRVVSEMPAWNAGRQGGNAIDVAVNIPINFRLNDVAANTQTRQQDEVVVEQMPVYPGGQTALMQHISKTVIWPDSLKDQGIEGRLYARFVVNEEGNVQDVEIVKGLHSVVDASVVEALNTCAAWQPGTQRGKRVKVTYTIPVRLELDGYKPKKKKRKKK